MASGNRPAWAHGFDAALAEREAAGLMRHPKAVHGRAGVEMVIDGEKRVNFCSNDYLGLADHPRLIEAWSKGARDHGVGAGASPLVSGRFAVHEELEQALAQWTGRERALLLPGGFQANLAVLATLAGGRRDCIVMDRLCHASLIDGARQSRGSLRRFAHGDSEALARCLEATEGSRTLVVSESLYSMDGDLAPLADYAGLCKAHGAGLFVDDAHGFGVLGETGRGGLEHHRLTENEVPLLMATFGKALGVAGAFVAGPAVLMEALVQYARPYIYSTAMPPALAAAVREALALMQEEGWRRDRLWETVRYFRDGARRRGLPLSEAVSPIQPLMIGDASKAVAVSELLLQAGFYVAAIRPPTVPQHSARLRITLSAAHRREQVDGLLSALEWAVQ